MHRLTTNKDVSEMSMYELAHNACYSKDRAARYRDFEMDMDARDFARNLMTTLTDDDLPVDDDEFDEEIMENLIYDPFKSVTGLIALFYRNLWAMADLRETLKAYEDEKERGGWIPCSERMPEEHDSMFARFKGTDKWRDSMFEKASNEVTVTITDAKGDKVTTHAHTTDGTWKCDILRACPTYRVIAWQPLPAPYQPKGE